MYEHDEEFSYIPLKNKLWRLDIKEAAELVILDMWVAGDLPDIDEPDDWDGDERDPRVMALLRDEICAMESRIAKAVDSGKLKAKNVIRDFDENLIHKSVRVGIVDLEIWLREHGYLSGDKINEWEQEEVEIIGKLSDEFDYLRALSRRSDKRTIQNLPCISNGPIRMNEIDSVSPETLATAYKALLIENDQLRRTVYRGEVETEKEQPIKADRPLTTRPRRTLLTIIAGLCDYSAIEYRGRGASGQIARIIEEIGVEVSEETVKKFLDEIPDALETRKK